MSLRRFFLSLPVFIVIFLLQEGFVTQMRLPAGGFSLFLIFTLTWAAMCTPELGALTGFGAGLLMDLSQTAPGPMGHWMITMIITCSVVSFLSYGDDHLRANPFNIVFLTVAGVIGSQLIFAFAGLMLGQELGSIQQVLFVIIGTAFWSAIATPIILPLVTRVNALVFGVKAI
jgi:rod shape-determining protein MreD